MSQIVLQPPSVDKERPERLKPERSWRLRPRSARIGIQGSARRLDLYLCVAVLSLTAASAAVAYVDLGHFNVVAALSITVGKMLLVALYFMHVRHSTQLTRLVVAGGLLWLAILITLTMADIVTRGWIGVPGR